MRRVEGEIQEEGLVLLLLDPLERLGGEEVAREFAKAVRGDGQDDDVRMADDLFGRDGARAWGAT